MAWRRARRPELKEQRRTAILDAARTMLDNKGLGGSGLNALAREAGMSKVNVYQYFESREASPSLNPSPACAEALARPEMAGQAVQLDRELGALLRLLIRGLRA